MKLKSDKSNIKQTVPAGSGNINAVGGESSLSTAKKLINKSTVLTIPNMMSFFRILLIPFIALTYFAEHYYISAGIVILSALTDVVDGFVARHFNMVSPLGKALDPIADKLTLLTIIICLSFESVWMIMLLVIVLVKEVLLGVEGLMIIKNTGTTYSSNWHGKLATSMLYLSMLLHIIFPELPTPLSITLIASCIAAVLLSFALYTRRNAKCLKAIHNAEGADRGKI